MKGSLRKKLIKDEKGMTLVEMLIGIVVLVMLLGLISALILRAFYINRFTLEQGLNAAEVQKTVRVFTRNLREATQADDGAYMIQSADDFELTFFANIDSDDAVERLHYYLEDHQLKLGITEPSGFPVSYPAGDTEVRIIGNGIVNTGSQPVFYYYNKDYPVDTINNPLSTPPTLQEIGLVKLDIYVNVNTTQVPNSTHMETFVRPRNISY